MSSVHESTDCQRMRHTCLRALSDTFITFHESVVPDMTPGKHMQANLFKNSLARQLAYATMGTQHIVDSHNVSFHSGRASSCFC